MPIKKVLVNNEIKSAEVRVIDDSGAQLGIFSLNEAISMAKEKGLSLVQVTEKVSPPICKIIDYGKYVYQQKKKEKHSHSGQVEIKGIRLKFGISSHDMETKAKSAVKFLEKGHRVKIELPLRGRQRALADFGKEKVNQFIEIIEKIIPVKKERELKKEARGFTVIISKSDK